MSAPPVRIGLVGYGKGGRLFHAPLIEYAQGCEIGGVVVRSPERRAALAADLPDVPVAGSLAELAEAGVDAVVVTTPLDSHVQLVHEAIRLGLPVVCDKPFTRDARAAREAVFAAEQAGVLLSVYQNRRWDADFRTVQQVVTAGAYALYATGLRRVPASVAGIVTLLEPLTATLLGVLVFGERLDAAGAVGALLLLGAVALLISTAHAESTRD